MPLRTKNQWTKFVESDKVQWMKQISSEKSQRDNWCKASWWILWVCHSRLWNDLTQNILKHLWILWKNAQDFKRSRILFRNLLEWTGMCIFIQAFSSESRSIIISKFHIGIFENANQYFKRNLLELCQLVTKSKTKTGCPGMF